MQWRCAHSQPGAGICWLCMTVPRAATSCFASTWHLCPVDGGGHSAATARHHRLTACCTLLFSLAAGRHFRPSLTHVHSCHVTGRQAEGAVHTHTTYPPCLRGAAPPPLATHRRPQHHLQTTMLHDAAAQVPPLCAASIQMTSTPPPACLRGAVSIHNQPPHTEGNKLSSSSLCM